MTVLVWITENGWEACVRAARTFAPAEAELTLLHVTDTAALEAAHGAFTALLGRSRADPGAQLEALAESSARQVLQAAEAALGRPAQPLRLRGRPERQVVLAARDATLLIVARDGGGAGPKSLGRAARFVVDHAPCPVLLVWPGPPPDSPPPPPPEHGGPEHGGPEHGGPEHGGPEHGGPGHGGHPPKRPPPPRPGQRLE
jgi:nucleotide-binding universal stress UspA family protein